MTEITVVGAGGEYMEHVVVVEWHKNLGDPVTVGELVVTVETAKAATEIEATADGILSEIRAELGDEVSVGAVLGVISDKFSAHIPEKPGADEKLATNSGASVQAAAAPSRDIGTRIVASPLARRTAAQLQVDLSNVTPSYPSGRIRIRDVEAYAAAAKADNLALTSVREEPAPAQVYAHAAPAKQVSSLSVQNRGTPHGEKVVFLHGFGGDSHSWQPLLAAIGSGFNFILVDLPAHGESPKPEGGLTVHQMAEAVSDTLAEVGVDDFHLVGHSLGGAVSLAMVARGRISIRSLTLIAPAGLGPEIDDGFVRGFARATRPESLSPWLAKLFAEPSFVSPAFVAATMQARSDSSLREAQIRLAETAFPDGTQATDLRDVLKGSFIPQKIIWGEQDRIIPMQHALRSGGQAGLHFLPGVGHMPQLEAPAMVARLLTQHIRCAS